MFTESVENEDSNIKNAMELLSEFKADMGGTEIFNPLRWVFHQKIREGYPRQVFLLTDGDVSDTNTIIKLVADNTKYSRCHTIGIGDGCSAALIKGCAEKGKGKAVFIEDGTDVASPIIHLLEESLSPLITEF